MVQIPTYSAEGGANKVAVGGQSSSPSFISNDSAGAKAMSTDKIASSLGMFAQESEARLQRIVQRVAQEKVAAESIETARYSRELFEQAKALEDDTAIVPFIQQGMQKRLDGLNEKYTGMTTLQDQLYMDTQRNAMRLEQTAFEFVENRQMDRHLATMDQFIFEKKADIIATKNEAARAMIFQDIDAQIDEAVKLNYISASKAGELKRGTRSDAIGGIIVDAIANDNPGYAATYLEANREFLSPGTQAGYTAHIKNKQRELQNRYAAAATKGAAERANVAFAKMLGQNQAEAFLTEFQGDPNDAQAVYAGTGGKVVMPHNVASQFMENANGKDVVGKLQAVNDFMGEEAKWQAQMDMIKGAKTPLKQVGVNIAASGELSIQDRTKLTDLAFDSLDGEKVKASMQGYLLKTGGRSNREFKTVIADINEKLMENDRYVQYYNALNPDVISSDLNPYDPAGVFAQRDSISAMVMMYHSAYGEGDDIQSSINAALGWLPPADNFKNVNGTVLAIPSEKNKYGLPLLNADVVAREAERKLKSYKPNEINFAAPDINSNLSVKQEMIESGNLRYLPVNHPSGLFVRLTDRNGVPVRDNDGNEIVENYYNLQESGIMSTVGASATSKKTAAEDFVSKGMR